MTHAKATLSCIPRTGPRWARLALLGALASTPVMLGSAIGADDAKLVAYGRHLAQECTSCHRIDGVDNGIPSIIGWDGATFVATLKYYQKGERTNPVMVSVAQSLNEEQLKALAHYYGSLPKPSPKGAAPAEKAKRK
jgi:cytochrome c553